VDLFAAAQKWPLMSPAFSFSSAEYKKCRQEIKKRSTDTVRLQKKAKKGQPRQQSRRSNFRRKLENPNLIQWKCFLF
jgi:hypothetical protein